MRSNGDRDGLVALVTGASRGGGRAIAMALAEGGGTVYVTGRSSDDGGRTDDLPGTIEETAETVTALGGRGIAVRCDHRDAAQVEALLGRVRSEQNRLELLVNNAWGGYEQHDGSDAFEAPFWSQPFEKRWSGMFEAGVRATLMTSAYAAPLMLDARRGLIVNTVAWDRGFYLGNLFYDVAKSSIVRATAGMSRELREHGVAAVALAPGFMRTERVMAAYAQHSFDLSRTESPHYLARAVVALARDAAVMRWSGSVVYVGELARTYGFTDENGMRPPPFHLDG